MADCPSPPASAPLSELQFNEQTSTRHSIGALLRAGLALALMAAGCASGCGDDSAGDDPDTGACLMDLPASCEPAINPTYGEIYDKIIAQRCGTTGNGTACHGRSGMQGKLGLFSADVAYDALLGKDATARARVVPKDPSCSILMQRLESKDNSFRMPLGESALSPGLRCAIQLWIDAGAER